MKPWIEKESCGWKIRLLDRSKWGEGKWNIQKITDFSLQFIEFSISGKTCTFFGNIHAKNWILALPVWAKVYSPCAALGAAWHSIVLWLLLREYIHTHTHLGGMSGSIENRVPSHTIRYGTSIEKWGRFSCMYRDS